MACLLASLALASHPERGSHPEGDLFVLLARPSAINPLQSSCHAYHPPIGVSKFAAQAVQTVKDHPELLSESF